MRMNPTTKQHIGWVDLLRVIACFLVVLAHCCDPFVAQFDNDRVSFLTGAFTGSMLRASVPLFVMMSAVLLLPSTLSLGDFYRKRVGRIVVPLIFWSIALPLIYFAYFYFTGATNSPSTVIENHSWGMTWNKIYTFIFNFNYDTTPLWYLYMLVGLYLIIPILSSWMQQASQKEVRTFLYAWGITLVLPYIKMAAPLIGYTGNYGNMGLFGVCDWNEFGTFYYVSGFIGYLVLAHYLVKYPLNWSWNKTLAITVPMFVVGYLITSLGFVLTQKYYPGSFANLEIVWYFAGINVFMMTFPLFVIVQKLKVASSPLLSHMASMTFGIYLCHFVFVQMAYDMTEGLSALPPIVRIVGMACSAFLVSYLITWIFSLTKFTRRFIA